MFQYTACFLNRGWSVVLQQLQVHDSLSATAVTALMDDCV
jgi:hypothetical protein